MNQDELVYVLSVDSGMTYTCTRGEFLINQRLYGRDIVTEISEDEYNELRNPSQKKDSKKSKKEAEISENEKTLATPNFES